MRRFLSSFSLWCVFSFFSYPLIAISQTDNQDIVTMSLTDLRQALDNGQITAEQVTQAYLDRIAADNHQGKSINAVITLNPEALAQAKAWDVAQAKTPGKTNPALSGIPFLAKDNYNSEGLLTTGGSVALAESVPTENAFVIEKIQDQGGILLGKTNMSELAASYGRLGYSSYGGQTRNPWNLKRDASGSSSGSAAAVAAGFAPYALGTDTSGSVRAPASVTGMVGLRPSIGLISRSGIIPLSLSADTVGVITRTVADQAVVLAAIAGYDPADVASVDGGRQDFSSALQSNRLSGKTLLMVDNFDGGNPEIDALKAKTEEALIGAGAQIKHITLPAHFAELWGSVLGPVGHAEFKPDFEAYLATTDASQPKTLSAFIVRIEEKQSADPAHSMNPARLDGLKTDDVVSEEEVLNADSILAETIPALQQELRTILQQENAIALVFPTMSCPASVIYTESDPDYLCEAGDPYAASYIASSTGFPEITVPMGQVTGGVPVGISFLGLPGDKAQLLGLANRFLLSEE